MKCTACGYEYQSKGVWIDKIDRYKSGKNKGEVKSIDKEWLDTTIGHTPFRELKFRKDVDELEYSEDWSTRSVTLYSCPECNTVRIDG